jgi:maleylpyruvate isomerase
MTEPRDLLAVLDQQTEALLDSARKLDDLAAASLCVGWSRGHVLAHLARNADGIEALVRAAVDGSGEFMYASNERRDADIEAGSGRPLPEQLVELASTAAAVDAALRRLGPEHADLRVDRTPGGMKIRAGNLPAMRLREVVYHHIDLQAGFGFTDLDDALLDRFLAVELGVRRADGEPLTVRTDDGQEWVLGEATAPGRRTVTGTRPAVLAWLARDVPDGVRVQG